MTTSNSSLTISFSSISGARDGFDRKVSDHADTRRIDVALPLAVGRTWPAAPPGYGPVNADSLVGNTLGVGARATHLGEQREDPPKVVVHGLRHLDEWPVRQSGQR